MEGSQGKRLFACLAVFLATWSAYAGDKQQDFPDLTGGDETGGLSDEFALLEEEIAADEVESASKHRQSIFWSPSAITVFTREDILASGELTNVKVHSLEAGYRAETGLTVRTPLGPPHREYPGYPLEQAYPLDNLTDYGGEFLVRRISVYLRGSF